MGSRRGGRPHSSGQFLVAGLFVYIRSLCRIPTGECYQVLCMQL